MKHHNMVKEECSILIYQHYFKYNNFSKHFYIKKQGHIDLQSLSWNRMLNLLVLLLLLQNIEVRCFFFIPEEHITGRVLSLWASIFLSPEVLIYLPNKNLYLWRETMMTFTDESF